MSALLSGAMTGPRLLGEPRAHREPKLSRDRPLVLACEVAERLDHLDRRADLDAVVAGVAPAPAPRRPLLLCRHVPTPFDRTTCRALRGGCLRAAGSSASWPPGQ